MIVVVVETANNCYNGNKAVVNMMAHRVETTTTAMAGPYGRG
jgi:hypothetical protein